MQPHASGEGSAADPEHLTLQLTGSFLLERSMESCREIEENNKSLFETLEVGLLSTGLCPH